jgi:hypothetical protein
VPGKKKIKATDDPILDATTIAQLAKALNDTYQLGWPVRFPPKSVLLNKLWKLGIQVTKGKPPRLYEANSTSAFVLNDALEGRVFIDIDQTKESLPKRKKMGKEKKNGQNKRKRTSRKSR